MIDNIEQKEDEIKKIWMEFKDKLKLGELYRLHLKDYFDDVNITTYKTSKDWLFFLRLVKKWKSADRKEEVEIGVDELTDKEMDDMQDKNRKRMILMLNQILNEYENSPAKLQNINISEVRKLYKAIQSLEEAKNRTEIQKGKLKLETVKTLLPYQRMSLPELISLKEKINDSFTRIIKLKSGEEGNGRNGGVEEG